LVAASRQGYYEAGADVHKDGEKDGEGEDALMLASSRDHACCTGVALQGSLSASKRQSRRYGAYFGRKRRYGSLIARSNARNHSGKTALMFASYGEIDLVRVLLAAGADPDIRNNDGETAFMMSANDDIRALLKRPPPESEA